VSAPPSSHGAAVAEPGSPPPVAAGAPRRRLRRPAAEPLVWIAPAVVVVLFVFGYSMVELFRTALTLEGAWAGLENFQLTVTDPAFKTAMLHNARLLLAVPVLVALALGIAVLIFEAMRGWRFHRASVFLPYVLPIPVVAVIFGQMLQLNGLINKALQAVGLDALAMDWLGQPEWALWTMTGVIVWKVVGFGVILFVARLLSLGDDMFEAARLDGARFWRLHRYITVPQLKSVIAFYVVIEAITMVSWVFNYVYVMTNGQGGPGDATMVTELYVYQTAFQYGAPELAAAASVLLFAATFVLILLFFRIQARGRRLDA
jgi:ABC-type sugar transport system permease subunit